MGKVIFSIIIPTYNRAWCIERAIKSVLRQEFQDWEMIIVDDGSTDDTKDVVGRYLSDKRIGYVFKENGGVGSARNVGITHAKGEICIFLDSDDAFFANDSLDRINGSIGENLDASYFGFGTVDEYGLEMYSMSGNVVRATLSDILKGVIAGEFLPCVRSDIFSDPRNRFPEDVNGGEGLLWWKIMRNTPGVFFSFPARRYYLDAENSLVRSLFNERIVGNISLINRKMLDAFGEDMKRDNKKMYCATVLVLSRMLFYQKNRAAAVRLISENPVCVSLDIKRFFLAIVALVDHEFRLTNLLIQVSNRKS